MSDMNVVQKGAIFTASQILLDRRRFWSDYRQIIKVSTVQELRYAMEWWEEVSFYIFDAS